MLAWKAILEQASILSLQGDHRACAGRSQRATQMKEPPVAEVTDPVPATEVASQAAEPKNVRPATQSKWYRWRKDGKALIAYLLDSEVHTFAFSVAANAIISFIPFIVLLYTL